MGGEGAVARDSSPAWRGLIVSHQEKYLFQDCTFRSEGQDLSIPDSASTSGKGEPSRIANGAASAGAVGAAGDLGTLSRQSSASKGLVCTAGELRAAGEAVSGPVVSVTVLDVL
jgi:hypothetical protein